MDGSQQDPNDEKSPELSLELITKIQAAAQEIAIAKACEYVPSVEGLFLAAPPSVFGRKWAEMISLTRDHLVETHKERVADVGTVAARYFIFGKWRASGFFAQLELMGYDGKMLSPLERQLSTPNGYLDYEGWAATACDQIAQIHKPKELLSGTTLSEYPSDEDLLDATAIFWFFEAAELQMAGDPQALRMLFEASDALSLSNGFRMWDEGYKCAIEDNALSPEEAAEAKRINFSELGRAGGRKRHERTRALKQWTIDRYRQGKWPSANKAAHDLKPEVLTRGRMLGATLTDENAQRTIAEWIREEKRKAV